MACSGAENRQPDDGNRQHALCPVDPAPLREATHPEGPAPKPRIRTSVFRPMNDEELMARAGGGSSDANYAASNRSEFLS